MGEEAKAGRQDDSNATTPHHHHQKNSLGTLSDSEKLQTLAEELDGLPRVPPR